MVSDILIFFVIAILVVSGEILREFTNAKNEEHQQIEADTDVAGMRLSHLATQLETIALASAKTSQSVQSLAMASAKTYRSLQGLGEDRGGYTRWGAHYWERIEETPVYEENTNVWYCNYCGTTNDHPIHSCTKCGAPEPRGKQW